MAERPVIVIVDDEPDPLGKMLDALARRFGGDYRVIPHLSANAALDAIAKIKNEKEDIALVIADQRMSEMDGRDFLGRVRSIVPMAKRALLVGWDADARLLDRYVQSSKMLHAALLLVMLEARNHGDLVSPSA